MLGLICDAVDNRISVFTEHPKPAQRSFHSETVSQFRSVRQQSDISQSFISGCCSAWYQNLNDKQHSQSTTAAAAAAASAKLVQCLRFISELL